MSPNLAGRKVFGDFTRQRHPMLLAVKNCGALQPAFQAILTAMIVYTLAGVVFIPAAALMEIFSGAGRRRLNSGSHGDVVSGQAAIPKTHRD